MKISFVNILLAVFIICSTITPSSAVEGRTSRPATSEPAQKASLLLYQELRTGLQQWAARCEPCNKPFPWKRKMAPLFQTKSFSVLTSAKHTPPQATSKLISNKQIRFYRTDKPTKDSGKSYDVQMYPDSYLVDKNGVSVQSHSVPRTSNDEKTEKNRRKTVGHVIDASG